MKGQVNVKEVYYNTLLKMFFCGEDEMTRSIIKAKRCLSKGQTVTCFVHVGGFGQWETSPLESIHIGFHPFIETKSHKYAVVGKERTKRAKRVKFMSATREYWTNRKKDLKRVIALIEKGEPIYAEVFFKRDSHVTSRVKLVYPARRKIITESYSIYKW